MNGASRLLSVRLQGFKSFAERTHVEFGPGISAVVGPNGSGKSNLADALRWALGEQGRALRSRKAEDVIWAGSERRPALGMADVQLVVDNADALLPVDYGVVELGRRLYRSGENEYLLNRQRVRLKDLVELLDAAHLADNAFLFIGQGMVDQALALRPEERRPLFEEVAGVRRHERRRRRADDQLAESEANLARVEDILGELRPQARRLAAQAEQVASRRSAGDELAAALVASAHGRWHAGWARATAAGDAAEVARRELDSAMARLGEVETAATALAAELADRARAERAVRAELDVARGRLGELRIAASGIASDVAAVERDRRRLAGERPSLESELAGAADVLAAPSPARDVELEGELARAERAVQDALEDAATTDDRVAAADDAVVRRLAAARRADLEAVRRRLAEAERLAKDEGARARTAADLRAAADTAGRVAEATRAGAAQRLEERRTERLSAEAGLAEAESAAAGAARRATAARTLAADLDARAAAAERAMAAADREPFSIAALARGGRRFDGEVVVEPDLRLAVRAALAGLGRAIVVRRSELLGLAREQGTALVEEAVADSAPATGAPEGDVGIGSPAEAAFLAVVARRGGGPLAAAIRRDDTGAAGRLLARVAWLPDLASCLDLQASLPPGWLLVARDGRAIVGDVVVRLGVDDPAVEARARADRLRGEGRDAETAAAAAGRDADIATQVVAVARRDLEAARTLEADALAALRRSEEAERTAVRAVDAATREATWLGAQAARLAGEVDRFRQAVAALAPSEDESPSGMSGDAAEDAPTAARDAAERRARDEATARIAELRAQRDRVAAAVAESETRRVAAERRRASAEAAVSLGRSRLAALDALALEVAEREARLEQRRRDTDGALRIAEADERDAAGAVAALEVADAAIRQRLSSAEQDASRARSELATAQAVQQAAEREDLEARLGLEAIRESVMVELAGLGPIGLRHLGWTVPAAGEWAPAGTLDEPGSAEDSVALAAAIDVAASGWATTQPPEAPTSGRLASLRRRFHELGAGNPFAVEEYEALRTRLDGLEAQRADLESAIDRTRTLILELDTLIATQFRTTFQALERAFEARFRQLFGGGQARLSLTDPTDLSATGVEIVARPPGKKPQPLAMLSGGERALTAVALLFAMLEVRPVPFCVLDEVDAALDEANVGRFTDALRELSSRTQCIVITHNRGTIETADALYGVTVGEDSVSRVISLRLEEATTIAAQATAAGAVAEAGEPVVAPAVG